MSKPDKVFGIHAVSSLLAHHGDAVELLYVQSDRADKRVQEIIGMADRLGIPIEMYTRAELDVMCQEVHQGVLALSRPAKLERNEKALDALLDSLDHPPLLLVLDGVTDPHNLGACLRSAEAAGVDAVLVPKDKSAQLNATVLKVASGAAAIVPFITVTNLARTMRALQKRGIWITGAAGEAEQSLYAADLTGPVALVLGSEGKGLRRLTREHCDSLVAIPMAGEVSSLNVSVSAGVCLFEAVRQRNAAG